MASTRDYRVARFGVAEKKKKGNKKSKSVALPPFPPLRHLTEEEKMAKSFVVSMHRSGLRRGGSAFPKSNERRLEVGVRHLLNHAERRGKANLRHSPSERVAERAQRALEPGSFDGEGGESNRRLLYPSSLLNMKKKPPPKPPPSLQKKEKNPLKKGDSKGGEGGGKRS